jgi:hypothetical protein
MATVADRPRARRSRAPRPAAPVEAPIPQPNDRIPEGWQPGGAATQAVAPARPAAPAGPPERHGKCSLRLSIGGVEYKLCPVPPPPGLRTVWTLTKIESDRADGPRAYAVASDGRDLKCTCPDHSINGARCKHIGALVALRLIERPAPPPVAAPAPAPPPVAGPSPAAQAEGFRAAVRAEIRRKRGGVAPCERCGVEISPAESYSPAALLCGDCFERQEGGAA